MKFLTILLCLLSASVSFAQNETKKEQSSAVSLSKQIPLKKIKTEKIIIKKAATPDKAAPVKIENKNKEDISIKLDPVSTSRIGISNYLNMLLNENRKSFIKKKDSDDSKIVYNTQKIIKSLITYATSGAVDGFFSSDYSERKTFLKNRIGINSNWGNSSAVKRDRIALKYLSERESLENFMNYIIEVSSSLTSNNNFNSIIESEKNLLKIKNNLSLPIDKKGISPKIYKEMYKNYIDMSAASRSYNSILDYALTNKNSIIVDKWYQKISPFEISKRINKILFIKKINKRISQFNTDLGSLFVSLFIFFVTIFFTPTVFSTVRFSINKVATDSNIYVDFIHNEIELPVKILVFSFGLYLATLLATYKMTIKDDIGNLFFIIMTLIGSWLVIKILDGVVAYQISRISRSQKYLRKELFNLATKTIKVLVVVLGMIIMLKHFGISIAAILSTLGIGGLAFALAAKDSLSNLFGGVTILFDDVMRMGDWVKIGEAEGTVSEVGIRSTTIRTFDNALITIPNSLVSTSNVINWNRRQVGRRIKLWVGLTYGSDMTAVKTCLEDIKLMLKNNEDISNPDQKHKSAYKRYKIVKEEDLKGIKNTQLVFLDKFNESSIDILIYCFSKSVVWEEWLQTKEDLLFKIAEIVDKNGLKIAFKTQTIDLVQH